MHYIHYITIILKSLSSKMEEHLFNNNKDKTFIIQHFTVSFNSFNSYTWAPERRKLSHRPLDNCTQIRLYGECESKHLNSPLPFASQWPVSLNHSPLTSPPVDRAELNQPQFYTATVTKCHILLEPSSMRRWYSVPSKFQRRSRRLPTGNKRVNQSYLYI